MSLCTDNPVVLLNPGYSGLGIARSLGPKGVQVFGISAFLDFPGNRSRWLEFVEAPDSLHEPEKLAHTLVDLASRLDALALLLPTRDHDVNFIATFREKLEERFLLVQPSNEILENVVNKASLNKIAESAGILVPRGLTIQRMVELSAARALKFPVICRPVYARQWRKQPIYDLVNRRKAIKAATFEELRSFYANIAHIDPLINVSEWIPGGEQNLLIYGSFNDEEGEPVAYFTGRKRLQKPPLVGTGIVVEAIKIPALIEPSQRLLRTLKLSGISEIEFKVDDRDGSLYLIEINPRHWDQHAMGAAAGVDLTEAAYQFATKQIPRQMEQTDSPVRWFADDAFFRHAARAFLGREPLRDALEIFGAQRIWAIWDRSDPKPFLSMLGIVK